MFRIESYITSIILSYVDRYIKNFRQQDAQVSLWEGDGSFQNLNLDLDVLEQELNLPFSFVSGHIHELLIHVPWTRLTSESVKITINTIECVMKLKPGGSQQQQTKPRKSPQAIDDPQNQSSLTSSLVNKIICNLSVTCNNLILKYVEEDIVLSMNIKTLSFGTVNQDWNPAFMELSATRLELRKLISLSDVTVCLDKRNASGRIESYLEPLLYRCFMTVRLWQSYASVTAKQASSTRLDILCEHMAFTVSEPQIPMLMRLMSLCLALHRKQLSVSSIAPPSDDSSTDKSEEDIVVGQTGDNNESWSSWALSWMPTLIPLTEDPDHLYDQQDSSAPSNNIVNLGFYINTFALALKLCEPDGNGGLKTQSQAFMHLHLQGCRMDLLSHMVGWTNVQMGICQATVKPDGDCCCGVAEPNQMVYLSSGSMEEEFVSGSLFDKSQSHLLDRVGHSWKHHLQSVTEAIMLERSPAFAVDYLSCNQDKTDDEESDDEDNERLPVKEKVIIRYVAGPVVIRLCSGLIHRIQMLSKACASYDYIPYGSNTSLPVTQDNQVMDLVHRLSEKSIEMDEDLYGRYLPIHTAQFTAFHTVVELYPANHMPIHLSSLGRKLSRSQRKAVNSGNLQLSPPPCVTVEWKCAYATLTRPLYPDKILLMASKFQRDKIPIEIVTTSLTRLAFKAVGVSSSVRLPFLQAMKVVEMSSVSCEQSWHSLITPLDDQVSSDLSGNIENITATSSKAKLILLYEIVSSLIATNNRQHYVAANKTIYNTSLLHDAASTTDTVYLKVSVDHLSLRRVVTMLSDTKHVMLAACHMFAVRLLDKGDEWETMIMAAPDTDTPANTPLLEVLHQQPTSLNTFPPLLTFKLREVRFSADPLLYSWLLYTPIPTSAHSTTFMTQKSTDSLKSRKVSESSLSSYKRRALTPQESIHSSSERETAPSGHLSSQPMEVAQTIPVLPLADRVAGGYSLWKATVVCGDVSQVSVYLPHSSLASATPRPMEEGLQTSLRHSSPPLQVAVVKLPSVSLRCGNYKQGVDQYTAKLPVRLPASLWTQDKDNFPWLLTISDLHCYTLHGPTRLPLLKPVSFNCTIGTSPKFTDRQVLTSLALCVHLDTTPVTVKLSEEQVVLMVNLAMAQLRVVSVLIPAKPAEYTPSADPAAAKLLSSDESSNISQSDDVVRSGGPVKVKLTGWLQWTLARTTLCMYNKPSSVNAEELKLALDVEDIILSLDVERVYHKVKFKVATASVCHHVRMSSSEQWKKGAFQGLVMRGYDPDGFSMKHTADDTQAPAGFLMATVTRALCNNFHSRLGSPSKQSAINKKSMKLDKFITEMEVKMQPLDFVLSPPTLGVFIHVLEPLLSLVPAVSGAPGGGKQPSPGPIGGGSILPLLYLDLMTIRVVLPASRQQLASNQPDVLIIQFDGMTANPHPENPICRTPLRPDIYHKGEKQRILNIPGSELEDRQYQFNLSNLRVQTGHWQELEEVFVREGTVTSQQNPALDWNEGRSPMFQVPAHQLMHPLVNSFKLSVLLAPAMIYQDKDVVCGHAVEVNAESDIVMTLTLDQLFLCGVLSSEMLSVLRSAPRRQAVPRTNITGTSPSTFFSQTNPLLEQDSGVESTESLSLHLRQVDPNIPAVHAVSSSGYSQISGFVHSSLPSSIYPTPLVWPSKRSIVPCEVLVTGSAFTFSMFKVEYVGEQISYEPLLYINVSQPHTFLSRNSDNFVSCQVSAFDLGVSCGVKGHTVQKQVVTKPLPQPLLETRSGDAHPLTGIPPAVLTVKVTWTLDKPPKVDVDMGRPLRIICNLEIIEYLKVLRTVTLDSFFVPYNRCSFPKTTTFKEEALTEVKDHYLRTLLRRFSKLSLSTQQIVLAVSSLSQGTELCLSVGACTGYVTSTQSLQQTTTAALTLDSVTLSTLKVSSPRACLLLSPWQLSLHACVWWESWLSAADPPYASVAADSDTLSLHLSPEQLFCLNTVWQDYHPLFTSRSGGAEEKQVVSRENSTGGMSEEEQQYQNDLQAGAFQFVEASGAGSRDDLPLTYQVVFWANPTHSHTPTMAWRYPQPRAITKFCLLPVPFRELDEGVSVEPTCVLQYYSESQVSYQDYATFTLSQTESQQLELPQRPPRVVATTWRVVLSPDAALVTPVKALAAFIRVDSFFSPSLVPAVQLAVSVSTIQVALWTYTDNYLPLPEPLDRYYLDRRFPEDHDFLTVALEQASVAFSLWPKVSQQVTVKGRARVDVLDYYTLSYHSCVPPFPLVATGYVTADCHQWSLVTGRVNARLGPALSHSLLSSINTWSNAHAPAILTPYVVCNNTCIPIRFRQAGSDEYIPLQCFQCHLYSWRTTKRPMQLEFGLLEPEDNDWSKGLKLRADSSSVVKLTSAAREYALIVSVKRLSPTVNQVIINGQLSLHNSLSLPVEVRILPESVDHCQSSLAVQSGASPPSVVLDPRHGYSLKVRFSPLSTFWSGEIPLKYTASQTKQWEVKLPLKDRGQFRSVWCHVVWDIVDTIPQIVVVLSPLYTIKSLLPCQANVVVETPAMASTLTIPITGRGAVQPLDTPGLSAETHNLTFQLDGKVPVSSPPVGLHYHMLDGGPSPPTVGQDVTSLLSHLQRPPPSDPWPYLGADWVSVDWLVTTQPDTVTHVKVRFSDDCIATNTLLVEVRPWALLVNTLGSHVYLQGRERTLCSLAHCAVISPPPLESTFQIGVELANRVELSDPIQLKRGPGFDMPRIPGLLPSSGFINTTITGDNVVSFMNVNSSEVSSLRLIHIRSSFVVASLSKQDLAISPIAIKPSDSPYTLPADALCQPLIVRSQKKSSKLKCQPLTEWKVVGRGVGVVPYLVVSVAGVSSCPVRVPESEERQSVAVVFPAGPEGSVQEMLVMTSQKVEGQTHLLLWDQPCPQLTVHNLTSHTILFAKAKTELTGDTSVDCEHIKWQLGLAPGDMAYYNFPATPSTPDSGSPNTLPAAVIAVVSPHSNDVKWSDPISLSQCSGRLLTLLGLPDLSLSVSKRGFTTHVTLLMASHTEILAVDIRGQLSRQVSNERRTSDMSIRSVDELPTVHEASPPPSFPPSESGGGERRGLDVGCYVHGLTATLLSQSELGCECHEVAALSLDYVGLTMHPHPHQDVCVREMKIHLTLGDMQLDNQEFSVGGYDFPVVMMMQKSPDPRPPAVNLSQHAHSLVEKARARGSAADLTVVVDTSSHASIAMQDVGVKLRPLQIYIEDKYILHVKECLMNTLPLSLFGDTLSKPFTSTKSSPSAHDRTNTETNAMDVQKPLEKEPDDVLGESIPKNDLSEGAEEEDLFNVSEPEDNLPEEATGSLAEMSTAKPTTPTHEPESIWTVPLSTVRKEDLQETSTSDSIGFPIPSEILGASQDLARPLRLRSLSISELDLLVSIHTSTRFYIALDHSPLQLSAFKRTSLFTTAYRLGHSLTLHYFFGAIYGTGWALGSLELLGAPGGLARSLSLGFRDFINLPLQGILLGPRAFVMGITHGCASLMQHFAAGTITSVTRLASSWARTLDRLTLDCQDLERSEQLRRLRPQTLSQGVVQGLTEFGISLIGAISSIAHHPLQYVMSEEPDRSLVNSIGLGLVGVITRPLSGVAELVALTGEGLLSGVGWTNTPMIRHEPETEHERCGNGSRLKYKWKLLLPAEQLMLTTEATTDCYEAVSLLVTNNCLYVVNCELDIVIRAVKLAELQTVSGSEDPTLVAFKILPAKEQAQLLSQSRVVEFVRESQRVLIGETSNMSRPASPPSDPDEPHLQFFISPQIRNHFLAVLTLATNHAVNRGFPVGS